MKLWLIGLALLCACATGRVTVPVLRPAEINLAQYRTLDSLREYAMVSTDEPAH